LRRIVLAFEEKKKAVFGLEARKPRNAISFRLPQYFILVGLLNRGSGSVVATFLAEKLDQAPTLRYTRDD